MFTVKKITEQVIAESIVLESGKVFQVAFCKGFSVVDENGVIHSSRNNALGRKNFSVFNIKSAAKEQADFLNKVGKYATK